MGGINTPDFDISRADHPDVWIIIPAYNEATVIGDVVADVRSVFAHVVCVDDGSPDDTGELALKAGAHVVRHPVNLGQGAAIALCLFPLLGAVVFFQLRFIRKE